MATLHHLPPSTPCARLLPHKNAASAALLSHPPSTECFFSLTLPKASPLYSAPVLIPVPRLPSPVFQINCVSKDIEVNDGSDEFYEDKLLASNVPWTCTPEDVRSLFEKFGRVVDVELSMHNKTKNRGLAFVTMGSREEALSALEGLELTEFQGRTLKLNYAKPKKKIPNSPPPPPRGLTFNLFVSNLSYEARSNDLKQFFISEGADPSSAEIIFHDDPRKSSGYGFVSFKSKKGADQALNSCQGKMFMNRPLRVARSKQFARLLKEETPQSAVESDGANLQESE